MPISWEASEVHFRNWGLGFQSSLGDAYCKVQKVPRDKKEWRVGYSLSPGPIVRLKEDWGDEQERKAHLQGTYRREKAQRKWQTDWQNSSPVITSRAVKDFLRRKPQLQVFFFFSIWHLQHDFSFICYQGIWIFKYLRRVYNFSSAGQDTLPSYCHLQSSDKTFIEFRLINGSGQSNQ